MSLITFARYTRDPPAAYGNTPRLLRGVEGICFPVGIAQRAPVPYGLLPARRGAGAAGGAVPAVSPEIKEGVSATRVCRGGRWPGTRMALARSSMTSDWRWAW